MIKDYCKDRYGLYWLSKFDIEEEIEAHLEKYDPDLLVTPKALDIEDFTENYLKLNLEYHKLCKDESVYGAFAFSRGSVNIYDNDECRQIYVNEKTVIIDPMIERIGEGILRFTIGHEDGHYLLQYELKNNHPVSMEKTQSDHFAEVAHHSAYKGRRLLTTRNDWAEWQANYASSCLLMNRKAVLKLIENTLGHPVVYKGGFLRELGPLTRILLREEISRTFNVSSTAARIRLEEISE